MPNTWTIKLTITNAGELQFHDEGNMSPVQLLGAISLYIFTIQQKLLINPNNKTSEFRARTIDEQIGRQ